MNKLLILTTLLLFSCSDKPKDIPFKTIDAVITFCSGRSGADYIVRINTASYEYQLRCNDGYELRFNHGDVLFNSKTEESYDHE